jgi:hypothetical protein
MRKPAFLLASVLLGMPRLAVGQPQLPPSGPIRAVLAIERVNGSFQETVHLNLTRVVIPSGSMVRYLGASAMVYLNDGRASVSKENDRRSLGTGDGLHISANVEVSFETTAGNKAELLVYRLLRGSNADQTPVMGAPASSTEVHRMRLPPSLMQSGPLEFSMTRVTLPTGTTRPRPHTRSGAALYYVLTEGQITIWPEATVDLLKGESRTESRTAGAVQEEPYGFIHSWTPTSRGPLILLQANISQEGSPEIVFVK